MKKSILLAVLSMLIYYLGFDIMYYTRIIKEFNNYSISVLLVLLPILPGIAAIFAGIKDSFKEYIKSLGLFFLVSFGMFVLYAIIHIILGATGVISGGGTKWGMLFLALTKVTGYLPGIIAGCAVSGIITRKKQNKSKKKS